MSTRTSGMVIVAALALLGCGSGSEGSVESIDGARMPPMKAWVTGMPGRPHREGTFGIGGMRYAPLYDPPMAVHAAYHDGLLLHFYVSDHFVDGDARFALLIISGAQSADVAPGSRYLDDRGVPLLRAEWSAGGVTYRGEISDHSLHIDLLTGVIYAELPMRLVPDDATVAPIELLISAEGYLSGVDCLQPDAERGAGWSGVGWSEPRSPECEAILGAIEAAAADPDAPPAPYDFDDDVIDCTVGEPCDDGEYPVAPLPM